MEALRLLDSLRNRGFRLAVHRSVEGAALLVQPRSGITPELRESIKTHQADLIALVSLSRPKTAREWEKGLHQSLIPFASFIECARRGLLPDGPTRAANVQIEHPSEWILRAVVRINQLASRNQITDEEQRKIKKALIMLEELDLWFDDVFWADESAL